MCGLNSVLFIITWKQTLADFHSDSLIANVPRSALCGGSVTAGTVSGPDQRQAWTAIAAGKLPYVK